MWEEEGSCRSNVTVINDTNIVDPSNGALILRRRGSDDDKVCDQVNSTHSGNIQYHPRESKPKVVRPITHNREEDKARDGKQPSCNEKHAWPNAGHQTWDHHVDNEGTDTHREEAKGSLDSRESEIYMVNCKCSQ